MDSNAPRWSSDVHQADWIGPRLAPWEGDYTAAIVVPAGFEAYARVLHPAGISERGDRPVRWAEVAAWSGMTLRQDAQFHSIALPPTAPSEPPPYHSQGPREGSLDVPDAEVLAGILREWTATPHDCWFCVWDGYGWESASSFFSVASAETGSRRRPPRRQGGIPFPPRCARGSGCSCRTEATSSTRDQPKPPSPCRPWTARSGSARTCGGPPTAPGAWPARSRPY